MSQYKSSDLLTISIARALKGAENCFHGVASGIPCIAIMLSRRLHNPDLVYLNITGGVNVDRSIREVSTDGNDLFKDSASAFGLADIFDLAARGGLDVAFLSGGQVDQGGRVNNSVIGPFRQPKVKLPGGAGSAVLIPNTKRAFVWKSKHEKRGLVERVDFITSQGNVKYVFTPLCTFEMVDGSLQLKERMPGVSFDTIQENTGFVVENNGAPEMPPPTPQEMEALNDIDPLRFRDLETGES